MFLLLVLAQINFYGQSISLHRADETCYRNEIQRTHSYGKLESASIAQLINDTEHYINISNFEVMKDVNSPSGLYKYETIYMRKHLNSY